MAKEPDGSVADDLDVRAIASDASGGEPITSHDDEGGAEPSVSSAADDSVETASGQEPDGVEPPGDDWVADLGPEYEGLSETQVIARLEREREAAARLPELERQAQRVPELEQYLRAQQQQIAAWQYQQQVAAQQQAEAAKKPKRTAPEWNPEWRAGIDVDEKGNIVAKSGWDPTLPQKYLARQQFEREEFSKLLSDPAAYVMGFAQEQIQQAIDQRVQQHVAQLQLNIQADNWDKSNAAWLYENQTSGTLSGWGQQALHIARGLVQGGVGPVQALEMAKQQLIPLAKSQQQPVQSQQAAQPNKDVQFLRQAAAAGAKSSGNRVGTGRSRPKAVPTAGNGMPDIKRMLSEDLAPVLNGSTGW